MAWDPDFEPSGSFLKCGLTTYGSLQVHRILDDGGDEQQLAAVPQRREVEVLRLSVARSL